MYMYKLPKPHTHTHIHTHTHTTHTHTLTMTHRGSGTPFGWSIANVIFFKKVHQALGLDRCHFPLAGGAPMTQDTLAYFMGINVPVHEMYGMSETSGIDMSFFGDDIHSLLVLLWFISAGPTTVTTDDKIRFMSSGRPFQGVEILIDEPVGEMVPPYSYLLVAFLLMW